MPTRPAAHRTAAEFARVRRDRPLAQVL